MTKTNRTHESRIANLEGEVRAIRTDVADQGVLLRAMASHMGVVTQAVAAPVVTGEVLTSTDEPKAGKKGKGKDKKTKAVEAPKSDEVPFGVLRDLLKQHKAAGLIRPGITVKEAIAEGLMDAQGRVTGNAPTQAPAKVTAAKVDTEAPAKVTEAEQARREAPRDAQGRLTPKREWALREDLALNGVDGRMLDRWEIDLKVAEAYANETLASLLGLR